MVSHKGAQHNEERNCHGHPACHAYATEQLCCISQGLCTPPKECVMDCQLTMVGKGRIRLRNLRQTSVVLARP